jgi:hypothetical protein
MKSLLLLASVIAIPVSGFAQFTPIADDFSVNGALVGSTPDSGVGTWTQISNTSPSLSVASGSLGLAASSGQSAQLNFASGNLSTGTIYLGWDFTVATGDSITTGDTIQAIAGFRSGTAASGAFEVSFGVFRPSGAAQTFSGAPSTTTSQVAVGIFTGASLNAATNNLTEWTAALNRGTQYRAVLGLDLDNDEARLWIAPASPASPSISIGSTAALRGVFFRQGGASHGSVTLDNLAVSQDFSIAAAAVPEPGSFALLAGLAATGMALAGRRRSRVTRANG